MTKLRTLAPIVRNLDSRTVRPPPRRRELIYNSPEYRSWRNQVVAKAGGRCEALDNGHRCDKYWPEHKMYADHIVELKDGGSAFDLSNGQCLCASHHNSKTITAKKFRSELWSGNLIYPDLPTPTCQVMLICGPPASGKSTYVKDNAKPDDIVIDLDTIAREYGFDRDRSSNIVPFLLRERNNRLARLAREPAERVAWVILGAPGLKQRRWWRDKLGVQPHNLVLLVPSRAELHRRVVADPDRRAVIDRHMMVIDKWFKSEIGAWPIGSW